MRKILEKCPTCSRSKLTITELTCEHCTTVVRSQYRPTVFSQLRDEDLRFIEIFVKNKGNVKDMERELNVSYWAIRNRLNEVIDGLEFDNFLSEQERKQTQDAILQKLEAGELTPQEAAAQLQQFE